jgi:cell filamentation protein
MGTEMPSATKLSIRFFGDREVRAVWDEARSRWLFSALDVVGAVNGEDDHAKTRNYWKWLKAKLRRERPELVSAAIRLKLRAADGKLRLTDAFDAEGVAALARAIPNNRAAAFLDWFTYGPETLDEKSREKARALFGSGLLDSVEVGTARGLRQIHAYLFGGLYPFAGQIRTVNLAKGDFAFAQARFLDGTLRRVEAMPETDFDAILAKYVEMNVAHPFREGNGRATRIWFDLMLKRAIGRCIDWSLVPKRPYLAAMVHSVEDTEPLRNLLLPALTDRIDDRETFMKGIDYSYYYEQPDDVPPPEAG